METGNEIEINGIVRSFDEYMSWIESLVVKGETSGYKQSDSLSNFTALNLKRMQRLNKTTKLSIDIKNVLTKLVQPQSWIVITEAWCGDSAQNLPVFAKIADEAKESIDLKIISRDDNPDLLDQHLTNGSRSIPKLISYDKDGKLLFSWGPRPFDAQKLLIQWKNNQSSKTWEEFEIELHTWYARDRGNSIQNEFYNLLSTIQ